MTPEVTKANGQAVEPVINAEEVELIKQMVAKDATDLELKIFLRHCQRTGLNPLARQIYGTKIRGKFVAMASIDGLRLTAQRTGEYRGQTKPEWCGRDGKWIDVWLAKEAPAAARIGVHRQNFIEPCYAVARYASYMRDTPTWKEMPDVMLAKCAEALALRKAFPQELSDLYGEEEMDQAQREVRPAPPPAPPATSAEAHAGR